MDDDDFKIKLEKLQTSKANTLATSNIRGGAGSGTKNTPEYWLAQGKPPTHEQVPDKEARVKILRAFMKSAGTSGKTFYND